MTIEILKSIFKRLKVKKKIKEQQEYFQSKGDKVRKEITPEITEVRFKATDQFGKETIVSKEELLTIQPIEPKLFNIEIQLGTDAMSGEPIMYYYENALNYLLELKNDTILIEYEDKTIASKYDIIHITEVTQPKQEKPKK